MLMVNQRGYQPPRQPTVVVCVDGCEPDYLGQAVAAGRMPWLQRTLADGTGLVADCVVPSFTNPNNLSIATGRPPAKGRAVTALPLRLRPLRPADQAFLWDMLHVALWDPPPAPPRPLAVLDEPGVRIYAEGWGRDGDIGVVGPLARGADDLAHLAARFVRGGPSSLDLLHRVLHIGQIPRGGDVGCHRG